MQDEFIPDNPSLSEFYRLKRKFLIEWVRKKVEIALRRGDFILNITFGESPIVPELADILRSEKIMQFQKDSDGLFDKKRVILPWIKKDSSLRVTKWYKNEFDAICPKRKVMGFPIKQVLWRWWQCDLIGVSTIGCVLAVNLDIFCIVMRKNLPVHLRVLWDFCMTSHPRYNWYEPSNSEIDNIYANWWLPAPIWNE